MRALKIGSLTGGACPYPHPPEEKVSTTPPGGRGAHSPTKRFANLGNLGDSWGFWRELPRVGFLWGLYPCGSSGEAHGGRGKRPASTGRTAGYGTILKNERTLLHAGTTFRTELP